MYNYKHNYVWDIRYTTIHTFMFGPPTEVLGDPAKMQLTVKPLKGDNFKAVLYIIIRTFDMNIIIMIVIIIISSSSSIYIYTYVYALYTQSCTSKGSGRRGVGSFCKRFLCFNIMPCRHMPLLAHS